MSERPVPGNVVGLVDHHHPVPGGQLQDRPDGIPGLIAVELRAGPGGRARETIRGLEVAVAVGGRLQLYGGGAHAGDSFPAGLTGQSISISSVHALP